MTNGEITRRPENPAQFLEGLFTALSRGGILQRQRGIKCSYSFARPPEEVTVLEVVELLEGEIAGEAAEAGEIWAEAAEALRRTLERTTIADVAEREARAAGAAMYHI